MKLFRILVALFVMTVSAMAQYGSGQGSYGTIGVSSGSGGGATNAISSISGPKLTAVYTTNAGAISATISILPDAEYSYNPVFVSAARGNDNTAAKYRYDLPYATLTNAYAACTNAGDLMYVLDGSFAFSGTAPTLQGFAEMFFASGVTVTNYTFEPTNLVFLGGPVWHLYGQGVFAADQSDIHNAFLYINNNPGNASTNSSITVVASAKGVYFPTNIATIVLGRSSNWTNYCYLTCSDTFTGSIEDDNGGANNSSSFCNVTAPTIICGAGSSAVGVQGSAYDQTNRFWSFNGRNMTLAPTGSAILYDNCTLIFGNGLLTDLRSTGTGPKKQQVVLNGTHFQGPLSMSGNPYFGTWTVDGVAPAVGYFGPTNVLGQLTTATNLNVNGPQTNQSTLGLAQALYSVSNAAPYTRITPSGLDTLALNKGFTNDLGARATPVFDLSVPEPCTNFFVLTNTTSGECHSNIVLNDDAFGKTYPMTIIFPPVGPGEQGTLSNYLNSSQTFTIFKAQWVLQN